MTVKPPEDSAVGRQEVAPQSASVAVATFSLPLLARGETFESKLNRSPLGVVVSRAFRERCAVPSPPGTLPLPDVFLRSGRDAIAHRGRVGGGVGPAVRHR